MTSSFPSTSPVDSGSNADGDFRGLLTWRGTDADRLEQVKLQLHGGRIKAYGRIIAAATSDQPAFSASYDLVTDDSGATKRLSLHLVHVGGDRHLTISRDSESNWHIQTDTDELKDSFGGAADVDLLFSPFFNSLPVRRLGLHAAAAGSGEVTVPLVYVRLPEGDVSAETVTYEPGAAGLLVRSPIAESTITADEHGIVVNYPGLATRI